MKPVLRATMSILLSALVASCVTRAPVAGTRGFVSDPHTDRILLFSATAGFRHDSIPTALATLQQLAAQNGLAVDATEDAARFNEADLSRYAAVVFVSTTREVLDPPHQAAFERYVAQGGGFVGMHAAADSGYTWPWYGDLVGAWFARHPEGLQTVRVVFENGSGPAGVEDWRVTDEIYDYRRNPRLQVRVIASVDPASHPAGGMGDDHPIAWCHTNAGGRAWYTGLGHDAALFADPVFRAHLQRGLLWSAGRAETC